MDTPDPTSDGRDAHEDRGRLGREVAERLRLPGPPGPRPARTAVGVVARAATGFALATSRPPVVRRMIAAADAARVGRTSANAVAPPRWWHPSYEPDRAASAPPPERESGPAGGADWGGAVARRRVGAEALPPRGLPRAARRVPDEKTWTPGGFADSLVSAEVRVRRLAEVAAVGRVAPETKLSAAAVRRTTAAQPATSSPTGGAGNRGGPGAGRPGAAAAASRAVPPTGAAPSGALGDTRSAPSARPLPGPSAPSADHRSSTADRPTTPTAVPPDASTSPAPGGPTAPNATTTATVLSPPPELRRSSADPSAQPAGVVTVAAPVGWRPTPPSARFTSVIARARVGPTPLGTDQGGPGASVAGSALPPTGTITRAAAPARMPAGPGPSLLLPPLGRSTAAVSLDDHPGPGPAGLVRGTRRGPLRRMVAPSHPVRPALQASRARSRIPAAVVTERDAPAAATTSQRPTAGGITRATSPAAQPPPAQLPPAQLPPAHLPAASGPSVASPRPGPDGGSAPSVPSAPVYAPSTRSSTPSAPSGFPASMRRSAVADPPGTAPGSAATPPTADRARHPAAGPAPEAVNDESAGPGDVHGAPVGRAAPGSVSATSTRRATGADAAPAGVGLAVTRGLFRAHSPATDLRPATSITRLPDPAAAGRPIRPTPALPAAGIARRAVGDAPFSIPPADAAGANAAHSAPTTAAAPAANSLLGRRDSYRAPERLAALAMPDQLSIRRSAVHGTVPDRPLASGFSPPEPIRPASTTTALNAVLPPTPGRAGDTGPAIPAAARGATAVQLRPDPARGAPSAAEHDATLRRSLVVAPPRISVRDTQATRPGDAARPTRSGAASTGPAATAQPSPFVASAAALFRSMMSESSAAATPGTADSVHAPAHAHQPAPAGGPMTAPDLGGGNPTIRRSLSASDEDLLGLDWDDHHAGPDAGHDDPTSDLPLDEIVDRVVERIEQRVVDELERRGRRYTFGTF